jgi:hypothetical protein
MKKFYIFSLTVIFAVLSFSLASNFAAGNPRGMTILPPAYISSPGGAGFLGPLSNAQRTYQMLIRDSLLTGLIGQNITAITWRLLPSATANWPAADVNFTDYDIYLSPGVAPENRSLTFAENIAGPQKKVRSGPLTITAGSYTFGGSPNAFGSDITFDSAYLYTGGHLLIEIRHSAFTGTSASVDAAGTSTPGYGSLYSACWQSSYTATSGLQGNFCVSRLNTQTLVGIGPSTQTADNYFLKQNYPNPFNPSTSIQFALPNASGVKLLIYNSVGKQVAQLVNARLNAGIYTYNWNAEGMPSGTYFYRLEAENFTQTRTMTLVK